MMLPASQPHEGAAVTQEEQPYTFRPKCQPWACLMQPEQESQQADRVRDVQPLNDPGAGQGDQQEAGAEAQDPVARL